MKGLGFIDLDNIDYNVVNCLKSAHFLFDPVDEKHRTKSV